MNHSPKCKLQIKNLMEENLRRKSMFPSLGNEFLDSHYQSMSHERKSYKFDFIIIKSFCSEKDTIEKMQR